MLKATNGTDTIYYTRGFELISRHEGASASYYLFDGSLSVRALTDDTGIVTDTLVFDAFGNETESTGTTSNTYGFQGEEKDATGLYYLRARYMDPTSGTFTSMDTYAGSLSDPMSLHKYLFANSNPVMYSDPSGHMSKLAEQVVTIGIMATLGAEMNGILYVFNLEDNNNYLSKSEFFHGLFEAMSSGIIGGIIFGLVIIIVSALVGAAIAAIIFGAVGLGLSALEIYYGITHIQQGARKTGATEIIFGVIGSVLSGLSIFNGIKGLISGGQHVTGKSTTNEGASGTGNTTADGGPYSGSLEKVNKPDPAADALAKRIGGESRVKFSSDPKGREFDVVSDKYVGQTKPALRSYGESWRNQVKATFEAAKATSKTAYFHFEGTPSESIINKIAEYGTRYGVKYIIDTNPLRITN